MTPRQMGVWLILAHRHRRRELAQLLSIGAMGSRGEPNDIKRQLNEWDD